MSEKVLSFEQAYAEDEVEYQELPFGKGLLRVGTVTSADMIQWINENEDKDLRKEAGLNLLVKSVVDAEGNRIPEDQRPAALAKFRVKDARMIGRTVRAILVLNGMVKAAAEVAKNVSGEARTGASPSN